MARLQSQAQVTVHILNDNDHLPVFAHSSYTFEIAENSAAQTLTSTVPEGLTMIVVRDSLVRMHAGPLYSAQLFSVRVCIWKSGISVCNVKKLGMGLGAKASGEK